MEWVNILKRKRSKHHSSRKIRRGRNVHQRFHRPKGGVPLEGQGEWRVDFDKKNKPIQFEKLPEEDIEAELAEQTKEDLIVVLTEKVQAMSKEDIIDLLVRTKGTLEE